METDFALKLLSLENASAISAIMAAVFWLLSSFSPIGDINASDTGEFAKSIKRVSRLGAIAAFFAGLSALAHATTIWLP
ncbi:MAG: hypothetical protein JKY49_00515 [Cohaesibacteraceae bacterium]|nr:hypothetical protein [Cohaesibacteraceae bacterium]MBL4876197.1 hypothetical protein [Cohaesibacteraceae bacterium]